MSFFFLYYQFFLEFSLDPYSVLIHVLLTIYVKTFDIFQPLLWSRVYCLKNLDFIKLLGPPKQTKNYRFYETM